MSERTMTRRTTSQRVACSCLCGMFLVALGILIGPRAPATDPDRLAEHDALRGKHHLTIEPGGVA